MEYGIQRRTIYCVPPEEDIDWIFSLYDRQDVWEMFGLPGPGRLRIMRTYREGNLVVGLLKRVADDKRIGFAVFYPPKGNFDFWEFGYVIDEVADRDAFSALNATDAMAHYMFEHLRVDAVGWRTRADNRQADAVVRRLGYEPFGSWSEGGHDYTFYRLDQAGWAKRRARLDRGEAKHPSGTGDTFVTLLEKPYTPVKPDQGR